MPDMEEAEERQRVAERLQEQRHAYLDQSLGTLIRMMDEWIRSNRPQ